MTEKPSAAGLPRATSGLSAPRDPRFLRDPRGGSLSSAFNRFTPFTLLALALLSCGLLAQSADRLRTEGLARRATERLRALEREAEALAAQQRSLLVDLRRLEVERDLMTDRLKEVDADVVEVGRLLAEAAASIEALEAESQAQRPGLETRLVEVYKLGRAGYLRMLLTVSDLRELGRAYRLVSALSALDRERLAEHRRTLEGLRSARVALLERNDAMTQLQGEAQAARAAAERAATARARLIAQIDSRRDLTAELAGELQMAQQRLQQSLGSITDNGVRGEAGAPALPIRPFRGDLDWPVQGKLLGRFGRRVDGDVSSTIAQNGILIVAPEGAAVRAVHEGTVTFTGPFTGYGTLVILSHGAQTFSLYGQLSATAVTQGGAVERGQALGAAGRVSDGSPGLYFEIRVDGKPVDPLEWLKQTAP